MCCLGRDLYPDGFSLSQYREPTSRSDSQILGNTKRYMLRNAQGSFQSIFSCAEQSMVLIQAMCALIQDSFFTFSEDYQPLSLACTGWEGWMRRRRHSEDAKQQAEKYRMRRHAILSRAS